MNEQERHNLFSELIVRYQSELYGYIFAVVRNWEDADDLFQSVCVVLWSKFDSFRPGSSFFSWARQAARLELSSFLRRKRLPNYLSEGLLDTLTSVAVEVHEDSEETYLVALRRCKEKLDATDKELLGLRYVDELGVQEIADRLQRLRPNVCRSLSRVRHWLAECIRMELAQREHSGKEYS